ncbi:hypothetical protein HDV63DRAFT_376950 [Trichoderma sp. SZMC 28014]
MSSSRTKKEKYKNINKGKSKAKAELAKATLADIISQSKKSIFKIRSCLIYPSRQLLSKRFLWHYVVLLAICLA